MNDLHQKPITNYNFAEQKICVIGYGRFGEFFCREVLPKENLAVFSPHRKGKKYFSEITPFDNLQDAVKNADVIIPAVPISEFENIIKTIAPHLQPSAVIMDVCSVKKYPVSIMKKYLPKTINQIATHPMFGPTTFKKRGNSLKGSLLVMQNVSADQSIYLEIMQYLKNLGIKIIEMDPEEHDRLAAKSQFFTQMVRFMAFDQDLKPTIIDTDSSALLFDAFDYLGTDERLIADILKYNEYSQKILKSSIKTLLKLIIKTNKNRL